MLAVAGAAVAAIPAQAGDADIQKEDNGLSLGIGTSNINYRETAANASPTSSALDDETGWLPTLNASYRMLRGTTGPLANLYIHLEGTASLDNTRYSGATLGGTPISATTKDEIYSTDIQIGQAFALGPDTLVTPYIEGGYRYWDRNLSGASGVEDYQNGEVMGGIITQYSPLPRWVFSVSGAGGSTILPQMSKSSGSTGNMSFKLGSTSIWRLRGGIGYRLTPHLELTGIVEFLTFSYGASTVNSSGFYEPKSTTQQTTLLSGLTWQFF